MYDCTEFEEANPRIRELYAEGDSTLGPILPSTLGSPIISSGGRFVHEPSPFVNSAGFLRNSSLISNGQSHVEDLGNISGFSLSTSAPLLSSSLLESDLNSMDASQLRLSLSEYMMENSSLKSEIQEKNRQIVKVKTQVKALLDIETSEMQEHEDFSLHFRPDYIAAINEEESLIRSDISVLGDNDDEVIHILPPSTFVFIREITSRIDLDQAAIREKMLDGIHVSNQIALGGVAGWASAYLLKNFGKTAMTAVGGGAVILAFAHRKGFVDINYTEIYEELQRQSEQHLHRDANGEEEDQGDWTADKIRNAKIWIHNHSVTVGGFICGFLYKLF